MNNRTILNIQSVVVKKEKKVQYQFFGIDFKSFVYPLNEQK